MSHDTRELCLRDFDHLDPKYVYIMSYLHNNQIIYYNDKLIMLLYLNNNCRDLIPVISALEYNTWFTKLRTSHIKLTHEAVERLLHIMKKSLSLEELYLDNLGLKWYVIMSVCFVYCIKQKQIC